MQHSHARRPGSGRPRSTDKRHDWLIMQAAVISRTVSREETRAHVTPTVSPRTIENNLLAAGLRSRVPLARPPLTPRHCQARLVWCREKVDWRVEWSSVVFSDESRFCIYASNGRTRVRRRPGECHLPECKRLWHMGPTSGFMVWGASVTTRGHIWCFCRVTILFFYFGKNICF